MATALGRDAQTAAGAKLVEKERELLRWRDQCEALRARMQEQAQQYSRRVVGTSRMQRLLVVCSRLAAVVHRCCCSAD